ncbi:hypothetical protein PV328_007178 [Microctonus aethiopoides]|uniref:Large ribosomal subunit protein bL34m n=1 Tax=Microctonus aethiopoides TaxID=144406 RepID=A0AA39FR91_9HYME|nr:hypothetical protein PV328_007178 [Microctonus aethiopoides]
MLRTLISNIFQARPLIKAIPIQQFSTTPIVAAKTVAKNVPKGAWSYMDLPRKTRDNFPRPSETKRVKTHGYKKRMSTLHGRKIIMRRILHGCYELSH